VLGERRPGSGCRPQPHRRGGGGLLDVGSDSTRSLPSAEPSRGGHDRHPLGWQPSRFLADRTETEGAFALAERLGSVNAAAAELETTRPSLRKAFTRHGLGMPGRNPEAVRQHAIAAARQRGGWAATPTLDPVFVALNPGALPARERPAAELHEWVRREEQYATLGANVVVELYSESRARQLTTRAWAIIRRADRGQRLAGQRASRFECCHADRPSRSKQPTSGRWRPMPADLTGPRCAVCDGRG
jgi:hypothetical protein